MRRSEAARGAEPAVPGAEASVPPPSEAQRIERLVQNFDHWAPALSADPYPVYHRLRDQCPVAHSDRHDGYWVLSRYQDVDAAARNPGTFSSTKISIPLEIGMGGLPLPPLDQDPPSHTRFRRLLLPYFSPGRTAVLEPVAREAVELLVDQFVAHGGGDAAEVFAKPVPITVMAQILGVEPDHAPRFSEWITAIVEGAAAGPDAAAQAGAELSAYFVQLLEVRRNSPRDDLLTFMLDAEVEGDRMSDDERLGCAILLLIAGIDTTWSALGSSLWYLAQHAEARRFLAADPRRMGAAVEELLRVFTPTSVARCTTTDVVVDSHHIGAGQPVLLPYASANRDEREFTQADRVVLDRTPNRHLAFGAGIHRCLGAHLARMELRVALEGFLRRVPDFHVADPEAVIWKAGPIRGPRRLDLAVG